MCPQLIVSLLTDIRRHVERYPVRAVYCGYVSKSHLLRLHKEMPRLTPLTVSLYRSYGILQYRQFIAVLRVYCYTFNP